MYYVRGDWCVTMRCLSIYASLFLILVVQYLPAQFEFEEEFDLTTPVARVGDEVITAEEFRTRFEMTVFPGKHKKGYLNTIKQRFLYGMIAEKLLAIEARNNNVEMNPEMKRQMQRLERMYARDRLYRDEVDRLVEEAKPEIMKSVTLTYTDCVVSFLHSNSSTAIEDAWALSQDNTSFQEIADSTNTTLVRDYEVDWQRAHPDLINAIYSLEEGEMSKPIETPAGWYIVRVEKKDTDDTHIENEFRRRVSEYRENLMKLSPEVRNAQFLQNLIDEYNVDVDAELFDTLAVEVERELHSVYGDELHLYEEILFVRDEVDGILGRLEQYKENLFLAMSDTQITVEEFVHDMYSRKFRLDDVVDMPLPRRIRNFINDQILDYAITRKAMDLNLHKDEDVHNELDRWRDHFLAESYKRKIVQDVTVDEHDLYNYYEDNRDEFNNPFMVNIREILVRTRNEAMDILRRLEEGESFEKLARRYSIRNWAARQGGEFGYFPSTKYGEIGRISAMLEPGQRFGPILIDEGYTIFELIDKKRRESPQAQGFDEVKESIEQRLLTRKQREIINDTVKELADRLMVDIDYEALFELDVSPLQVLVVRHFGFGGVYPAVPMMDQILQWSEEWLIDHNLAL